MNYNRFVTEEDNLNFLINHSESDEEREGYEKILSHLYDVYYGPES